MVFFVKNNGYALIANEEGYYNENDFKNLNFSKLNIGPNALNDSENVSNILEMLRHLNTFLENANEYVSSMKEVYKYFKKSTKSLSGKCFENPANVELFDIFIFIRKFFFEVYSLFGSKADESFFSEKRIGNFKKELGGSGELKTNLLTSINVFCSCLKKIKNLIGKNDFESVILNKNYLIKNNGVISRGNCERFKIYIGPSHNDFIDLLWRLKLNGKDVKQENFKISLDEIRNNNPVI